MTYPSIEERLEAALRPALRSAVPILAKSLGPNWADGTPIGRINAAVRAVKLSFVLGIESDTKLSRIRAYENRFLEEAAELRDQAASLAQSARDLREQTLAANPQAAREFETSKTHAGAISEQISEATREYLALCYKTSPLSWPKLWLAGRRLGALEARVSEARAAVSAHPLYRAHELHRRAQHSATMAEKDSRYANELRIAYRARVKALVFELETAESEHYIPNVGKLPITHARELSVAQLEDIDEALYNHYFDEALYRSGGGKVLDALRNQFHTGLARDGLSMQGGQIGPAGL